MNNDHSPAFRICEYWYMVMIAPIHTMSSAQFRINGVVSSGNANRDREALLTPGPAQLRICDMAELLAEGASFALCKPEDSVPIYNTIVELLTDWRVIVERNIVDDDVPLESLKQLDVLAAEIYKTARIYIKPSDNLGFFNRINIFGHRPMPGTPRQMASRPAPTVKPDHTPIADAIAATLAKEHRPWR